MEPNRREFQKQCAFQSFCKTVLHNEACDVHKEIQRHRVKEVTFSDLALHEEQQLHTSGRYLPIEVPVTESAAMNLFVFFRIGPPTQSKTE